MPNGLVFSKEILKDLTILVAGDIMLDRYVHGDVNRISPESPVPVLSVKKETATLGGAGNVYANLKELGVKATIIAVIGDDDAGRELTAFCGQDHAFLTLKDRPTIQKTRFIGNGQQLLRADQEDASSLSKAQNADFVSLIKANLKGAHALVLSDYGKGALSLEGLKEILAAAKDANVKVLVDPKGSDYARYAGASVVTPNRKELGEGTHGLPTKSDADITIAAKTLLTTSGIQSIVATRSADGMTILSSVDAHPVHIKTEAREVFDVSGAGDTVIATLAVGLAAGHDLVEAAKLANKAAGIVVAKAGTAPVTYDELFVAHNAQAYAAWDHAAAQIKIWQQQGLKVGFTNGCFDILHAGHVTYLAEARSYCDRLVVGLNHDQSVKLLKGPTRPVNDEASRAIVLNALASVDMVALFGAQELGADNTPIALLETLKPDILFKGGDYTEDQLPEAKVVRHYGGDVKLMGLTAGKSTTNIIKKIAQG